MLKEKKEWIDAMRRPSEHPSLQTGETGETGETGKMKKKSVESELQEVRERIAVKMIKMYEK